MKTLLLKLEKSTLLIILLVVSSASRAQIQTYTTPGGSFVTPAGVSTVQVEAYGAGGGGGYGGSASRNGGGGGGGGAYTILNPTSVTAGNTYTITVGAGGTAGISSAVNGGNGGLTQGIFNTTVTANGGTGGRGFSNGGTGGAGATGGTRNGGTGATGTTTFSGGGGGGAGSSNGGSTTTTNSGSAGGLLSGPGGSGNNSNNNPGVAGISGNIYGGGGGGGTRSANGGAGAPGYLRVLYTCPTYSLTSTNAPDMCGAGPATVTLRGSAASLPTGNYTVTYNLTGSTTLATATASMTVTTAGIGTFTTSNISIGVGTKITVTNLTSSYCSNAISSNNDVTIAVVAAPVSVAGTNVITCSTAGAVNITAGASASNATTLTWSSSGTGTFANSHSIGFCTYTPSIADILAGNVTITLTVEGDPLCADSVSTKTLTISNAMTVNAGGNLTSCASSPISVTSGSSATNTTSTLWSSSGTGTFSNAASMTTCTYTPSAADITAGSVTITLTGSNAGCPSVTATKTITINGAATAVAGTPIDTCPLAGGVNITAGSSATNYVSVVWTSSGSGTFTNSNSLTLCTYNPSALDLLAGTVTLTLTATGDTPCANATSTKTFTIRAAIIATAGTNVTTCSGAGAVNITAGATSINHTTITWTSSGTGTFASANSLTACTYTPSAADRAAGSVTITMTASNGGCPNVVSTKTLTIVPAPTAVAGTNIATCSTTGAVNITAGASATNSTSVVWSGGAGTFANANSLTNCTYTPSTSENASGATITLTLTVNGNAPCGSVTSTKTLSISRAMTVAAGSNVTVCYTSGSINVSSGASATDQTLATWSSNGTGTLTAPNSLGACSYIPSAADIAAGSVIITLTVTNAGCAPLVATKTLTINTTPTAVAGTAIATCSATGAVNVTAGSSATSQTSVLWTSSGTGSFTNATSLTTCTYTPSSADITAGSVTLTLTAYGASPCGNVTSTKPLTITTTPTVTGTTPGSRTGAGTVLLGATASAGTLNWYAASTGGSSLGTGTSFTTPVISVTTTFYVETITGTCASPRTPVIATVNYSEIDIQGNAVSIVDGDTTPSATDWTDFGTTNATRTFTIRNVGSALLTVGAVTISGANASEFTVTTPPAASVGIGGTTTFTITFAPTATGLRTADVSIVNNDGDENPYDFSIQATGVEQEIDIQGNAVTIVDGDTTPSTADWTDFSTVAGTRTFTIRNTGNIALTIGAITIGGANASDFSVTTPPASTVAANSSTTFVVTFAPSAINTRTATISIVNNDNTENPYDFAIQGFGVIPEIDIQGNATSIPDSTGPAATTANWTDFSSTAGTRTFTIFNNGNIALTLGAITFTGTNATEFTVTTPPAASVAAFSSTTFVVNFAPTALGARTAQIHIVNNDSNENPYDFNLAGTGVAREIDLQGLGLSIANNDLVTSVNDGTDFGSADINLATVTRTFTIRNTGSLSLTISNPTITGTNPGDFSITANPGTLSIGAGSSTTFQVTFNPTAVFTRSARINIVNNDSDENPYIFAIQGTGLLDNDGDGIENNTDQDDDNDGIIDTVECGTCVSDPFQNGGFESPVIGTATYAILPTTSVPGWQTSAENFIEIWSSGMNGGYGAVPAAAGNQFAELNANIPGTLYQSFCLNGAGGTINWAIKHRGRAGSDTAYVRFGLDLATANASTPVVTMTDGNTAWGSYSGTYTIPAGQTTIVLAFQAGPTATGDSSYGNLIDDVNIIINQNCVDTDGDGIADILDVDSDNDGIPDIEEAGFKQYSNNTATMDKTNVANWKDTNANGICDYIDSRISANTYVIPDADGDGVYNHLDLDSDNDSLWDVDEAGLINGDGDINDDGKGDGPDAEGDGLLNLFDNSSAFGSAFRPYAQDSDLNGISDYLQLDANDDGINDIQTGLYGSFDTNGDGRIDGTGDSDLDGILNIFDTNDILRGSPRDLDRKLYLDFDGRNDYAEDTSSILGGLSNATIMAFIDLNPAFSGTGMVVGQNNFHIKISSSRTLQAVVNGTTLTFGTPLNTAQWYHVAATYGGGTLTLYLNGKSVATVGLSGSIGADTSKLTLGKDALTSTNYFKGKIDEVRVFNVALTNTQLERQVYQELATGTTQVRGLIVPKDIGSLPFTNMLRYYRMDTYKDDIVDNVTTTPIDLVTGMKLYNHKVIAVQQAPLPFTTVRTGTFAAAVHDATRDIRGLDVLDFDYSIIQVKHNITETANSTDLALFIDPAVTVNMTNDTKLQNDWYLLLNGKIDLTGKSQLVQTTLSDLDVTSAGSLERDQQGQTNKFNYNYWSSPVSTISAAANNLGFTVAGNMRDGTNASSPLALQWTAGVNGSPTTPITLSSYWIFKFQNSSNAYANWASVGQNGTLMPGQGYTMKGAGAGTSTQNYTFVGKPNNGTITTTVGPNNLNLCGNPYASAIDADKFIDDNVASMKGTLYLWEHYSTNTTHTTIQYQGGYATYTKTGGTAPVAPAGVSGLGSSSKTPKRFIPVGQGFFVTGNTTGGTITFNNGQRLFVKEDDAVNSYSIFKANNNTVSSSNPLMNNEEDDFEQEQFTKIRLGYNSTDNLHRQTLLGFMNQYATSGYDNGYDGISIETLTNDMYFINGTDKLNISGDGFFNVNNIYPIGVKNATSGNVTFVVDATENFDADQEIYIFDSVTETYNSIKSQPYEVNLPAGTYESRFSLRFTNGTNLGTDDHQADHGIAVTHSQSNNMINIKNVLQEVTVKSVSLYNLLGQKVTEWKIDNQNQANIQLQVSDLSTGTYIVKVITDGGEITKKILVKK